MINLLIGPPGGGKSYEAVVYHILPALAKGRKVITNLPLDLARVALIDPCYVDLIETRTKTKALKPEKDWEKAKDLYQKFGIAAKNEYFVDRPFAHPEDYGDTWRHPETGSGPLYVIDECHLSMPRGTTKIAVEEWYSLHRHESADVLLITQSYGKVSKSIIDLVQVCYRVKKATAFGSAKKYIRKVQDGVRGEVVNTTIREYQQRYFGLYVSHTKGGGAELAAEDIIPIWKRWPFIGAAIFLTLAVVIFNAGGAPSLFGSPKKKTDTPPSPVAATPAKSEPAYVSSKETEITPPSALVPVETGHPYAGRTLHIIGVLRGAKKTLYEFAVAQNGQTVVGVNSMELQQLGYRIEPVTDCAVKVGYSDWSNWVICDAPQVSIVPSGAGVQSGSRKSKPATPPDTDKVSDNFSA